MAGKGSKPRPIKDKKKFDENWDFIFGQKEKLKKYENNDRTTS